MLSRKAGRPLANAVCPMIESGVAKAKSKAVRV
jgi:hypothetical protein